MILKFQPLPRLPFLLDMKYKSLLFPRNSTRPQDSSDIHWFGPDTDLLDTALKGKRIENFT